MLRLKALKNLLVFLMLLYILTYTGSVAFAQSATNNSQRISDLNQQIKQIEEQISQYQGQILENSSKAKTLNGEIRNLENNIAKIQLTIKNLNNEINKTGLEIEETQKDILNREQQLEIQKATLSKYLRDKRILDEQTLTEILLQNATIADFFLDVKNLSSVQSRLKDFITSVTKIKSELEIQNESLKEKKGDLEELKGVQNGEKINLQQIATTKNTLLKETKGEESKYQKLVEQSRRDLAKIKEQIFFLQQNGVSVEDAVTYGKLAAERAGIRPAFLIAILEVETGLGKNVGTGNWQDDMIKCYLRIGKPQRAETEKRAFLDITSRLGLNPDSVKVSREPNYGCGGAMGPAQFIASTWVAYEKEVSELTGHNPPNPWNIGDAFTAAALKLAKGGAKSKTREGEIAAAKAYVSGNSKCTKKICEYYSKSALNKAAIIEQNL